MLCTKYNLQSERTLKHPVEGGGKKKGGAVKAISCWLEGGQTFYKAI